jgi:hypothetical protein
LQLNRRALDWLETADISPPAIARLAERAADVAARTRDTTTIHSLNKLIGRRDRGRGLRSYRLARLAIAAALDFARGDMLAAARKAREARAAMFFSRSLNTLALLEADAWAAAGRTREAADLYSQVARAAIPDGDIDTWTALRPLAVRACARLHCS